MFITRTCLRWLASLVAFGSTACVDTVAAADRPPAAGSVAWSGMQAALSAACSRNGPTPVRVQVCLALTEEFARGRVDLRSAASERARWAYGWLARVELGRGRWGGAVFHAIDGQWLVVGFDGHDPEAARPACSSAGWREMQGALAERCNADDPGEHAALCARLSEQFDRCSVKLVDAVEVRGEWGDGLAATTPLPGATWGAAVFQRVSGRWLVVAFDGGEIK